MPKNLPIIVSLQHQSRCLDSFSPSSSPSIKILNDFNQTMLDYSFHITTPRLYISHLNPSNDAHCDFAHELIEDIGHGREKPAGAVTTPEEREIGRELILAGLEKLASSGYGRYLVSLRGDAFSSSPPLSLSLSSSSSSSCGAEEQQQGEEREEDESDGSASGRDTPIVPFSHPNHHQPIGVVTMQLARFPGAPSIPDPGFGLLKRYFGKGYATEAARGLVEYFEREKGQKEFLGYCARENMASRNVMMRLGFEEKGMWKVNGVAGEGQVLETLVYAKGVGREPGCLERYGLVKVVVEEEEEEGILQDQ